MTPSRLTSIPTYLALFVCLAVAVSAQTVPDLMSKAGAGNADAQYTLGTMYFKGSGVPKDYAEAADLYRKAAVQGYAKAQFVLGFSYYLGRGVPKDDLAATQ